MKLFWIDVLPSGRLATATRPRGEDWLAEDLRAAKELGVSMIASMLTPVENLELGLTLEAECSHAEGIKLLRVPVEDRGVPERAAPFVEAVDRAVEELRGGRAVVVHCRMGIGRSSMFAAATLVRSGFEPDDAWSMIERARGRPVPDVPEQRDWIGRMTAVLRR